MSKHHYRQPIAESSTLPEVFWERLALFLSPEQVEQVRQGLAVPRPTTFRVNTLKATDQQVLETLQQLGFEVSPVEFLLHAYTLTKGTLRDLTETDIYKQGWLYVQSLSSMLPPLALAPKPGDHVLDLAAAPGSKTTQMAALMENRGSILANDTSLIRLYKLQANLDNQGVTIVQTQRKPGQDLWQLFPEVFDKTLADVPCSMEGRFILNQPKTWGNWSTKKVKELSTRQKALLRSAVSATKPGGEIVYSTCTLSVEENEAVVQWLLDKAGGAVELIPMQTQQLPGMPGITQWRHKQFSPTMSKTWRVLPSPEMEGFFVARFRKLKSTLPGSYAAE